MKQKNSYVTPCVFRKIPIDLEGAILAGSVVDSVSGVKTTGQDMEEFIDVSSSGSFNHSWEE